MNKSQFMRQQRMRKVSGWIKEVEFCSYKKLIAQLMVEDGLARRTAKEHVDMLVDNNYCDRDGDDITYNKTDDDRALEREKTIKKEDSLEDIDSIIQQAQE